MARRGTIGIFCLEGNWTGRLADRASVEPTLDLLERLGHTRYIHRHVATPEELSYYLRRWKLAEHRQYSVLYLAFHGERGGIWVNPRQFVTLDDLADELDGSCADRIVYFGSCSTMKLTDVQLLDFKERIGAAAVCGFRKQIDCSWASGPSRLRRG